MTPPEPAARPGPLIIISGPSGTGKTTLVQRLQESGRWPLRLSVSATTRPPRPGETDGRDYYFWTREHFEEGIARGEFLEFALVHGSYYGTLAKEVGPWRNQGFGVILVIDVQGARQVWDKVPDHVSVFVHASSLTAYEERLRRRGTESDEEITRRLETARRELDRAGDYRHHVLNDDIDAAQAQLAAVVDLAFARGGRHA